MGIFPPNEEKKSDIQKTYEQMQHPGQRLQVDGKTVPRKRMTDPALRLFRYIVIDEFPRLRFLAAHPEASTYPSSDFLNRQWYARHGIHVECVQTDNGFAFANRFSSSKRNLSMLFEDIVAQRLPQDHLP